MASATPCPTPEIVDDLLANRLPAAAAEAIRHHLATCPLCLARKQAAKPAENPYPFLSPPQGPDELGWLDDHRIVGVLGTGGMAFVFDAEDTRLGRRVALKVLRPHLCDPVTRERFLREARLIAGLPHDHIVTVYQVGEANGVPFLTMERLEGEALEDRLQRDEWLPVDEALSLTREAAEGLVVAHEEGLVHRDIKPANIWLESRNGRYRRVKLIDFGIARIVNQESGLTTQGQVIGTPMYMAPEQAAGKQVDGRADLYSLGCVLFHLLTGKPPISGQDKNTHQVLYAIIKGQVPRISQVAPQLPVPVAALLQQLLASDPNDRPASARALVETLKDLEASDLCKTVPPPPSATVKPMRRPALLGVLLGGTAIAAALLVGLVAFYLSLKPKPETGDAAAKELTGEPIRVGMLHSITGWAQYHEAPVVKATEFAFAEIKPAGILGRPVVVVPADGASDPEVFARQAARLIEEEKVDVLFGCWTSAARKRVAAVCAKHDRLLFYPAMSEGLEASPNVVYLGGMPNQTFTPLLKWACREKGKKRVYLLGSTCVFSHAVHEILRPEVTGLGATVVRERYAAVSRADFAAIAADVKASNADLVINTFDGSNNKQLCAALRATGLRPPDVLTVWDAISEPELVGFTPEELVGDCSIGCYFESQTNKENVEFLERFRKQQGVTTRVNDAAQTAYFGVRLYKKAVEKADSTAFQKVRAALKGLSVDAPEGPVRLDDGQHAYRTPRIGLLVQGRAGLDFAIDDYERHPVAPVVFPPSKTEAGWKQFLDALYVKWGNRWETTEEGGAGK